MIDTDLLIAYEEGTLEREDFLKLFQQIYDTRSYTCSRSLWSNTFRPGTELV